MKEQLNSVREIVNYVEPSAKLNSGSLSSSEYGFECSFALDKHSSKVHFRFEKNQCEWTVSKKRGFFSFSHPVEELIENHELLSLFLSRSLSSDWQVAKDREEALLLLKNYLCDEGFEVQIEDKHLSRIPAQWTPYYPKKSRRLEIKAKQFHMRWRVCLPSSDTWLKALGFFLSDVLNHSGRKVTLA